MNKKLSLSLFFLVVGLANYAGAGIWGDASNSKSKAEYQAEQMRGKYSKAYVGLEGCFSSKDIKGDPIKIFGEFEKLVDGQLNCLYREFNQKQIKNICEEIPAFYRDVTYEIMRKDILQKQKEICENCEQLVKLASGDDNVIDPSQLSMTKDQDKKLINQFLQNLTTNNVWDINAARLNGLLKELIRMAEVKGSPVSMDNIKNCAQGLMYKIFKRVKDIRSILDESKYEKMIQGTNKYAEQQIDGAMGDYVQNSLTIYDLMSDMLLEKISVVSTEVMGSLKQIKDYDLSYYNEKGMVLSELLTKIETAKTITDSKKKMEALEKVAKELTKIKYEIETKLKRLQDKKLTDELNSFGNKKQ